MTGKVVLTQVKAELFKTDDVEQQCMIGIVHGNRIT